MIDDPHVARHVANARQVTEFLSKHPAVSWVNYPELSESRYRALSQEYLPKGPGAIFTFGIKGGREAGRKLIENVQLLSHLANVGDCKSLIIYLPLFAIRSLVPRPSSRKHARSIAQHHCSGPRKRARTTCSPRRGGEGNFFYEGAPRVKPPGAGFWFTVFFSFSFLQAVTDRHIGATS